MPRPKDTIKVLKGVLLAFFVLSAASCSSSSGGGGSGIPSDEGVGTSDSELEGFWVLTGVNSQPVLPDNLYLQLENASSSGIQVSFLNLRANFNCFDQISERVAKVGENRYQDRAGDFLAMTVQGSVLTVELEIATMAEQVQSYRPVVGITVQDLPLCKTTGRSTRNSLDLAEHMLEASQNQGVVK